MTHLQCPKCGMVPKVRPMGGVCDNCNTRYCTPGLFFPWLWWFYFLFGD